MGRDTFDAVLASVPQGATAARVTARGEHYDPEIPIRVRAHSDVPTHSDAPMRCVPMPNAPNFVNLTGRKFGRFTVVGYLGKLNPKNDKPASWLVRCVCGDYETRRGAAVKRGDPQDCCAKCFAWRAAQKRYEREGGRPVTDFFTPVKESTA